MTPERAAWVREHAWTAHLRSEYRSDPGYYHTSKCQQTGPLPACARDRCTRCPQIEPGVRWVTLIYRHTDRLTPWRGPLIEDAQTYGWLAMFPWKSNEHPGGLAEVYLADRTCLRLCDHECHRARQLDLFGEES